MLHSLVRAVGAGLAALALVAHLWMLDAPHHHGSTAAEGATVLSAPADGASMSGCPSGMTACRVPMPGDPLTALIVPGLLGLLFVGTARDEQRSAEVGARVAAERAPPPRPTVPASVVLLL
jgi:hypothetical protein